MTNEEKRVFALLKQTTADAYETMSEVKQAAFRKATHMPDNEVLPYVKDSLRVFHELINDGESDDFVMEGWKLGCTKGAWPDD